MSLRKLPYGANYLDREEMKHLDDALKEKILFRYTTERRSSGDILEEMVSSKFRTDYVLATLNCTQGLRLALLSTQPKVGDKVYMPAMTFIATAGAILSNGLIPVLVDVDENFTIDISQIPKDAERAIVCHMDGHIGNVPEHVPFVIEDVAQSIGGRFEDGMYAGTKGSIGVYSFQHAKILTSGQGGIVVTDDKELYSRFRSYHDHGSNRQHGEYPTWDHESFFGENMIANEAQTSIQIQQLDHLQEISAGLERGYAVFEEVISDTSRFRVLTRNSGDQKLSLRLQFEDKSTRDRVLEAVKAKGLPFWNYDRYFLPDHPVLKEKNSIYADNFPWSLVEDPEELWGDTDFSETKARIESTLCLSVSPEQSVDQQYEEAKKFRAALDLVL